MRQVGSSSPAGFHDASGMIGSETRLAASSATWIAACRRGASLRVVQSE